MFWIFTISALFLFTVAVYLIRPTPDEKAIRAAADDLGKSIGDAAVLASHIRQQIAPILTDEQKHEIGDFRSQSDAAVDKFFAKMADGQ